MRGRSFTALTGRTLTTRTGVQSPSGTSPRFSRHVGLIEPSFQLAFAPRLACGRESKPTANARVSFTSRLLSWHFAREPELTRREHINICIGHAVTRTTRAVTR